MLRLRSLATGLCFTFGCFFLMALGLSATYAESFGGYGQGPLHRSKIAISPVSYEDALNSAKREIKTFCADKGGEFIIRDEQYEAYASVLKGRKSANVYYCCRTDLYCAEEKAKQEASKPKRYTYTHRKIIGGPVGVFITSDSSTQGGLFLDRMSEEARKICGSGVVGHSGSTKAKIEFYKKLLNIDITVEQHARVKSSTSNAYFNHASVSIDYECPRKSSSVNTQSAIQEGVDIQEPLDSPDPAKKHGVTELSDKSFQTARDKAEKKAVKKCLNLGGPTDIEANSFKPFAWRYGVKFYWRCLYD
ncbi:hypothetical protein [Amphritea japonica]|nr:hypothetical protein [Amphritea japonica]